VVAGILLGLSLLMLRGLPAAAFVTQAVLDVVPDFAGGTFQRTGLISNPQGDVSGVQLMPIGLSGEWVRDARVLPVPLQELTATSWGNRIYVMGGRLADGQFSKRVFVLRLADDGSIAAVQDAPQLPVELVGASSFVHETGGVTSIYVVGGLTKATDPVSRAVYRANIDPVTGLTGAWQKLPDNQSLPFGLYYSALAVRGSDVYLVGGIAYAGKFQTVPNVFRTHVLPSGDLTGWDSLIGPGGTNSQLPPSFAGGVAAASAARPMPRRATPPLWWQWPRPTLTRAATSPTGGSRGPASLCPCTDTVPCWWVERKSCWSVDALTPMIPEPGCKATSRRP
jgi:hypothetical protein